MSTFVKNGDLSLVNGGYLVKGGDVNCPVSNTEFVAAQLEAHKVMTYAKLAKGMDFKGKSANTLAELDNKVNAELATKAIVYFAKPEVKEGELTLKLQQEVKEFMSGVKKGNESNKLNDFMVRFDIINEYETFGLFVESKITKLAKLYTIAEIKEAATSLLGVII